MQGLGVGDEIIENRLEVLRQEHRDLDMAIGTLAEGAVFDQLRVQRLKKRKLLLRDQIRSIEDQMVPDIIA